MPYKNREPFPSAAFVESQRNFTYFDKSLTSGLSDVTIESPGDFLYIDQASTGYVYVELNQRQSGTLAPILLAAGGSIECDFASVKLYAPPQLNKSVRIVIGNGARIKGGANVNASSMSVSVVDGGLARTVANQSFLGAVGLGAVAASYPFVQLWNPSGSGKNLYVEAVSLSSSTSQAVGMGDYSSALSTLNTANYRASKYSGQPLGVAELRYQSPAGLTLFTNVWHLDYVGVNAPITISLKEPILLPPNRGLVVYGQTVNTSMAASFEWFEQ